ncbi:MAG: RagB/SusD family nutrient uptake outer membrane protein [Bacteroidetes bacterium]|nr:MAG: RagB/SusD family nutrient uptake outer membrane protein [Bacteroidota bacterium]
MKKFIYILIVLTAVQTSCKKYEDKGNPNAPSLGDFAQTNTLEDLNLLVTGVEASMKIDLGLFIDEMGIVGREVIDLTGIDPRFSGELLGKNGGPLDPGGFLTTRSYASRYRSIRTANTLLLSLENTSATLTEAELNGYKGFANTLMAFQLLYNANMQYNNGIRIDVADPSNLGPFTSNNQESLAGIEDLLNTANTQLMNAGTEFKFSLTTGFLIADNPAAFAKFNRAIAARVAMYMGDKAKTLQLLDDSFMDLGAGLYLGVYHTYNTSDGITNPLYHTDNYMADTMWVFQAEAGDSRLWKVTETDPVLVDDITSNYRASIYTDPSENVIISRNGELILLYAEANIGINNNEAVVALNIIRNAAGVGDYTGATDDASLEDEMLRQRRYELFGEGHRLVDMRRYDRLDELTIYRPGDIVHMEWPRPTQELE